MSLGTLAFAGRLNLVAKRQLLWKEIRQLGPLGLMMFVLLLFIVLMVASLDMFSFRFMNLLASAFASTALINFPCLFAIGVGGILVGAEKDKKTIQWLSSLPISSMSLINAKLLAGLIGLGIAWLIFGPISLLVNSPLAPTGLDWSSYAFSLIYSIFLLMAGLAVSWRMKSSTLYLVVLIPIAMVPFILAGAFVEVYFLFAKTVGTDQDRLSLIVLLVLLVMGGFLFWQLNYWFGIRCLAPEKIGTDRTERSLALEENSGLGSYFQSRLTPPVSALTWQAAKQARQPLLLFTIMIVLGLLMSIVAELVPSQIVNVVLADRFSKTLTLLSFVLVGLGAGWMGVIVFALDGKNDQIRFLADRGVSTSKIFVTRLLVPLTIVLVMGLFHVILVRISGRTFLPMRLASASSNIAGPLLATLVLSFLTGVWSGQFFKSLMLAFLGTPILTASVFILGYLLIGIGMLNPYVAVLCLAAPLVSTFWLTGCWAERKINLRFIVQHVGWLLFLLIILIAFPILADIWRHPLVNRSILAEIEETKPRNQAYVKAQHQQMLIDWRIYRQELDRSKTLREKIDDIRSSPWTQDKLSSWEDRISELIKDYDWQSEIEQELEFNDFLLKNLTAYFPNISLLKLQFARCQLLRMSIEAGTSNTWIHQQYPRMLNQLVGFAKVFRKSPKITSQNEADHIEIFLLQELMYAARTELLERADRIEITEYLADKTLRRGSRLRAVASSWFDIQDVGFRSRYMDFYQFNLPLDNATEFEFFTGRKLNRINSQVITDLWRLANANTAVEKQDSLNSIADTWGIDRAIFSSGIDGYPVRLENAEQLSQIQVIDFRNSWLPGIQWNAGWEDIAVELHNQWLVESD